jgi:hypothetical protein
MVQAVSRRPVTTARLGLCWFSGERCSCRTGAFTAWSYFNSVYWSQSDVVEVWGGRGPGNFRTSVTFLRESGSDKLMELLHCSLSLFKGFSSRPTRRWLRHCHVSITLLPYRATFAYLAMQ